MRRFNLGCLFYNCAVSEVHRFFSCFTLNSGLSSLFNHLSRNQNAGMRRLPRIFLAGKPNNKASYLHLGRCTHIFSAYAWIQVFASSSLGSKSARLDSDVQIHEYLCERRNLAVEKMGLYRKIGTELVECCKQSVRAIVNATDVTGIMV